MSNIFTFQRYLGVGIVSILQTSYSDNFAKVPMSLKSVGSYVLRSNVAIFLAKYAMATW